MNHLQAALNIRPHFKIHKEIVHPVGNRYLSDAIDYCILEFNRTGLKLPLDRILVTMNIVRRGRCKQRFVDGKLLYHITIPAWTTEPGKDVADGLYIKYYLAHELCHVWQYERDRRYGHNETFYTALMRVIPSGTCHYELSYKSSAAKFGLHDSI